MENENTQNERLKILSSLSEREKKVLNREAIASCVQQKLAYPYSILIGLLNINYENEMKDALRLWGVNKGSLIDIIEEQKSIPIEKIIEYSKLILEGFLALYPHLESMIDLNANEQNIDIIEGVVCKNQDPNQKIYPSFEIPLNYIFDTESNNPPLAIVSKEYYEELKTNINRFVSNHNNEFDMLDIVKDAYAKGASDIHILFSNTEKELYTVRFKIFGNSIVQKKYTMSGERFHAFRQKVFTKITKDTGVGFDPNLYNVEQGGIMLYGNLKLDVRVQTLPKGKNKILAIIGRILKRGGKTGNLSSLVGYDANFMRILKDLTWTSSGLVIITGVTDSGKSTLLTHFTSEIPDHRIVGTIEDPIEYVLDKSNIVQSQMFEDTQAKKGEKKVEMQGIDYVRAWKRSALDVGVLGELRESEGNALASALVSIVKAGSLGLTTVHINSAFDVPNALVTTYGVKKEVVSNILKMIINQTLVQKLCDKCKIEDTEYQNAKKLKELYERKAINFAYTKDLEEFIENGHRMQPTYLKNEKGCRHCNYQGISGRTPIYEYLNYNVEVAQELGSDFLNLSNYDIEKKFCEKGDIFAKNKLTVFMEKLVQGEIDTSMDVVSKALL